jgi:hypothetical protein
MAAGAATAAEPLPKDPTDDPMLITAGFLEHHPDLHYRLLGLEAYDRRKFDDAFRFFRRAAFYADKPSQGMVAEMYWNGEGTPRDTALAYAWMDLAAERGYRGFIGLREGYWTQLDGAARERALREGEAIYARFGDAAAKPRYEFQLRVGRREMTGSRTGFNHGVRIDIPGPEGGQSIEGSRFYDERYWNASKYWAWQDRLWMKPRIGKVRSGDLEQVRRTPASRVPEVAPQLDAREPDVPVPPQH